MLDRDGTLIVERNYLSDPRQVQLLPGVVEGLLQLRTLGLGLVMITNQSGISRGYFSQARLEEIHQHLLYLLGEQGVSLDGIFVCPHQPEDNCPCRKPRPGLVTAAAAQLSFNPADGFVIGDKPCDIELGQTVRAKTILVRTGYGEKYASEGYTEANYIANDFLHASAIITRLISPHPDRTG